MKASLRNSPASISAGEVILHIIEAEFDFLMKEDLPPREGSYTQDEVMARVDSLIPAIEIPDSRYKNWSAVGIAQLIADNAIASILVLGEPAKNWRDLNLANQSVAVRINGETVDEGSGANVLGDPRNVMTWLANTLSARGTGLKAGQIITTGSAANVIKVKPGDTVVADFGDLGSAEVTFD
jgi:2-keto-4-pentenoate hydratase